MKKILLLGCLTMSLHFSDAQVLISLVFGKQLNTGKVEFGLDGGLSLSTIQGLDGAKYLAGFNLGFYFDIKMKNPAWMINTGVIVKSPMGAKGSPVYSLNNPELDSLFKGGTVTTDLRYYSVPIMLKYKFQNNFYVKAGIQLGWLHKAVDEFTNSVDGNDLTYNIKTKDRYYPLDGGLVMGLGYRLMGGNGMNISLQYYIGLINIVVDNNAPGQKNQVFYANVGIPIGKGGKGKTSDKNPQ